MAKIEVTVTAKVKLTPTTEQAHLMLQTILAYRQACNVVSQTVYETKTKSVISLHKLFYHELRTAFHLRSQMAQSVLKTVVARYKSVTSNGHPWTRIPFKKPEYDLAMAS